MTTKIGLPVNRQRLKGLGVEHAKNSSFDEGYNAGFDAGVAYYREQTAESIHQLGVNSVHYAGYNALVYAHQAAKIALGLNTWEFFVEQEKKEYKEREQE